MDQIIRAFYQGETDSPSSTSTTFRNIKNIGEVYLEKSKSFDPENKYSVPHFWGTVGVIYNTKMVSEEDAKSWKMFLRSIPER